MTMPPVETLYISIATQNGLNGKLVNTDAQAIGNAVLQLLLLHGGALTITTHVEG